MISSGSFPFNILLLILKLTLSWWKRTKTPIKATIIITNPIKISTSTKTQNRIININSANVITNESDNTFAMNACASIFANSVQKTILVTQSYNSKIHRKQRNQLGKCFCLKWNRLSIDWKADRMSLRVRCPR